MTSLVMHVSPVEFGAHRDENQFARLVSIRSVVLNIFIDDANCFNVPISQAVLAYMRRFDTQRFVFNRTVNVALWIVAKQLQRRINK